MQNWNLRHLQNTFFDLLSHFLHFLFLKFLKKCKYELNKLFFKLRKVSKKCQKARNFTLISNLVLKSILKRHQKSYKQNKHIFVTFLLITFFLWGIFQTFSTDLKSAWNSAFFNTYLEFLNKIFFVALISSFLRMQMRMKWMCLRI